MLISFVLNKMTIKVEAPPDRRVVDLLREDLQLTGTKEACGSGECGACTILVDGRSRLSCLMLAAQLEGRQVTTIEGLAADPAWQSLLTAFVEHGAVQCGYCSPGMALAAADLLTRQPQADRQEIRLGISGNICRCAGYEKTIAAITAAAQTERSRS